MCDVRRRRFEKDRQDWSEAGLEYRLFPGTLEDMH